MKFLQAKERCISSVKASDASTITIKVYKPYFKDLKIIYYYFLKTHPNILINQKYVENLDLLGRNFHTVTAPLMSK